MIMDRLRVCVDLGMENVIIEPNKFRAATPTRSAVLVDDSTELFYTGFSDHFMAITRVDTFLNRLSLVTGRMPSVSLSPMEAKPYYKMASVSTKTQSLS